jgi:hypothetical protein
MENCDIILILHHSCFILTGKLPQDKMMTGRRCVAPLLAFIVMTMIIVTVDCKLLSIRRYRWGAYIDFQIKACFKMNLFTPYLLNGKQQASLTQPTLSTQGNIIPPYECYHTLLSQQRIRYDLINILKCKTYLSLCYKQQRHGQIYTTPIGHINLSPGHQQNDETTVHIYVNPIFILNVTFESFSVGVFTSGCLMSYFVISHPNKTLTLCGKRPVFTMLLISSRVTLTLKKRGMRLRDDNVALRYQVIDHDHGIRYHQSEFTPTLYLSGIYKLGPAFLFIETNQIQIYRILFQVEIGYHIKALIHIAKKTRNFEMLLHDGPTKNCFQLHKIRNDDSTTLNVAR